MGLRGRLCGDIDGDAVRCQRQVHERGQPGEGVASLGAGQSQQGIQAIIFDGSGQSPGLEVGADGQIAAVGGHLDHFVGAVFTEFLLGAFRRTVHDQRDERIAPFTAGSCEHAEIGVFDAALFGFDQYTDGSHISLLDCQSGNTIRNASPMIVYS